MTLRHGMCDHTPTRPRGRRFDSYTAYSIGCAVVWTAILVAAERRTDAETRHTMRLFCAGWWIGWTSATIARVGYPPPKPLTPAASKRLERVSLGLVTIGVANTVVVLVRGGRHGGGRRGLRSRA